MSKHNFNRFCGSLFKKLIVCSFILFCFNAPISFATKKDHLLFKDQLQSQWRPVIQIGLGATFTPNAGTSQNFLISNPVTDEFYYYYYSPTQYAQTQALFNLFLGAETQLNSHWALQLGIDYLQTSPYQVKGEFLQGADLQSANFWDYQYKVLARQLLLEGKLLYNIQNKYHPYFLLGLGASLNRAYDYKTTVPPFLTFSRAYQDHTQIAFTYSLGIGLDVDMTQYWRAGLGYRFADLGQFKLGRATIDNINVSGSLSQSHLYSNELLAQLTYLI